MSRNSGLSSFDNVIGLGKGSWIYTLPNTWLIQHISQLCTTFVCETKAKTMNFHILDITYILHVFIEISDKGTLHLVAVIISHKIEF